MWDFGNLYITAIKWKSVQCVFDRVPAETRGLRLQLSSVIQFVYAYPKKE